MTYSEDELEVIVGECLDNFYRRRLQTLDGLKLKDTLKRKNPYLYRATGSEKAADIVEGLLGAYMSSSDEGIFGDAFFEPLAKKVSGGTVSPSDGIDIAVETERSYKAIAVKSGPNIFNAQSKKKQNENFATLRSRLQKIQKHFDAVVGYGYGQKVSDPTAKKIFREISGQVLWEELTGDSEFYLKIIRVMKERPLKHKEHFIKAWDMAINRFTKEFIDDFCFENGSIKWEVLTEFNSGKKKPKEPKKPKSQGKKNKPKT